jgi:hypothetical protein
MFICLNLYLIDSIIGVEVSLHHRTYTRIPLALDVQLQFKGVSLGQTFTRNINPFGAFIELPESKLITNDFIKICFIQKDEDHTCIEQKGLVIHCNKEGVGIIFASDTAAFRNMLNQEMSHSGVTAMSIRLGDSVS